MNTYLLQSLSFSATCLNASKRFPELRIYCRIEDSSAMASSFEQVISGFLHDEGFLDCLKIKEFNRKIPVFLENMTTTNF